MRFLLLQEGQRQCYLRNQFNSAVPCTPPHCYAFDIVMNDERISFRILFLPFNCSNVQLF